MYEIEPIKIRDKVKKDDKRPLDKIIKEEAYKIGFDPCYFIITKGFFELEQEFLYFKDTVYQIENTKSTTCEICGRLVIGHCNEPKIFNFTPKQQVKPLSVYKIEVKACDECSVHLNNIGFENVSNKNIHSTPLPIKLKGKPIKKNIFNLNKYPIPFNHDMLAALPQQLEEIYNEPITLPDPIPQELINKNNEEKRKLKEKEIRNQRIKLTVQITFLLLSIGYIGFVIYTTDFKGLPSDKYLYSSNSSTPSLKSLADSENYLLSKFPQIISNIKDEGGNLYITINDSFWYGLTSSQKKQFADRMVDVLHYTGNPNRNIVLIDQNSYIIAQQTTSSFPYMNVYR